MRCLAAWVALVGSALGFEDALVVDLLDNGNFREARSSAVDERAGLVPWWSSRGRPLAFAEEDGAVWLRTAPGTVASQPIAAYAPLADDLVVRGRVRGRGVLALVDGEGGRAAVELASDDPAGLRFELGSADWRRLFGRAPQPRFVLELGGVGGASAEWTDLAVDVPLPLPSEEALRAEIVEHIDWILRLWIERGADREGPRASGFFCHAFDCVNGERLFTAPGGVTPLAQELLRAVPLHENDLWRSTLERFLADYLELGLHPETGLPQKWDALADRALADRWVEIASDLRFLIDVHERGPEDFRARALDAARRIGETVLARGVLPDGAVAAKYRAADAAVSIDVAPLRRLDVPAQLARLGALCGDERFTAAARNALGELEYAHHWPGTWDAIDPGFDDDLGHYGARAVEMERAHGDEPAFRNFVDSGLRFYLPLWKDALRFGGAIAADQVRSWELCAEALAVRPELSAALQELLPAAARAHFKGEQYANGAFGDVTFFRFDPKSNLSVGDLPGSPSNLLWGLALAYDAELGLARPELRAMYTAVLRSTDEHYRRPYGYLVTQRELSSGNRGGGELRLLVGLVEMLGRL